jgi:hypothetical protein
MGRKRGSSLTEEAKAKSSYTQRYRSTQQLIQTVDELAAGGGPVQVTGTFLGRVGAIPWLHIQYHGNGRYRFMIDRKLRDLCDWYSPDASPGGQSRAGFYKTLRAEIKRRREEANYRRAKAHKRWTPESVIKLELCQLIDWIEAQLDTINPGQSANAQEDAFTPRECARQEESHGKETQFGTCPPHTGTCPEIRIDEATSGRTPT